MFDMKFHAFVARFADAIASEAIATELLRLRRERAFMELARPPRSISGSGRTEHARPAAA